MNMLKKISLVLAVLFMLTSCGTMTGEETTGGMSSGEASNNMTTAPSQTPPEAMPETAIDVLSQIWNSYGEEERFFAAGGDYSEEHMTDGGPGIYDVQGTQAQRIESRLGFPSAFVDTLSDAASLYFLMNANTFTGGVYHLKEGTDSNSLAESIRQSIQGRNWVCGMPEKLLIVTLDGFILSAFGHEDFINPFKAHILAEFKNAKIYAEEPISFDE